MISTVFEQAACRGVDPDLHFPLGYGREYARQIEEARQVCRRCLAYDKCLEWALANPDMTPEGIWAGTTPGQRRQLRRIPGDLAA